MKICSVLASVGLLTVSAMACSKAAISPESTGVQTAGAGGSSGTAGAGGQMGGAGGQAGAAGTAGAAGSGGSSGAAGGAGEAGAAGAAGAPSNVVFGAPDIVPYGARQAHCIAPVSWSKDGRKDVITVHDWSPAYTPSSDYKSFYERWRIVNGKLAVVAGPVSLEPTPGAPVEIGLCTTTDLDHDGVVEVTTSIGHHWIRPEAPIGKVSYTGRVVDLDGDGTWEAASFSVDGKTLSGAAVESKDGMTWTAGALVYSLALPFSYGAVLEGDFDGDGRADLALHDVSKTGQVQVLRAAPGGPQVAPVTTVLDDFSGVIVADMDGDGRADLVGRGKKGYQAALSDGKGGFSAQLLLPNSEVEGLAATDGFTVGDISGDGRPDLIVDSPAGVYIVESDGPGTWRPVRLAIDWKHTDPGNDLGQLHLLRVVDMDGDGKNDLVARRDLALVAFRNITPSP